MAGQFILNTVDQTRNFGDEKRDERILEAVLEGYRKYHRIGDADLDCDLHFLILRHLGVIGSPIGLAVMVRLPEFRRYFAGIGIELEVSRRRFLVRALTTLTCRGLVFRLDPHPTLVELAKTSEEHKKNPWPAQLEFRYALHRIVQKLAVSKLHNGHD